MQFLTGRCFLIGRYFLTEKAQNYNQDNFKVSAFIAAWKGFVSLTACDATDIMPEAPLMLT